MRSVLDVLVEQAEPAEARGEAHGQVEGRQCALARVLQARFGETAGAIRAHIATVDDAARLDRGLELAVTADSLAAFRRGWD